MDFVKGFLELTFVLALSAVAVSPHAITNYLALRKLQKSLPFKVMNRGQRRKTLERKAPQRRAATWRNVSSRSPSKRRRIKG